MHKHLHPQIFSATVLSQASAHTQGSAHPQVLTILWYFRVLRVTHMHAKFLRSESEGRSHSCDCSDALWVPWHQASKICTHIRGLVRSVLPLQHEICVLQATTECCGNLATRVRVGPLYSTIQLSSLSGWPQQITDKLTMQVNLVPWQLTSHTGWALAWG